MLLSAVGWFFRAIGCYTSLRRLQKNERHIYKCLCHSNLLLFHALEKDNGEADRELAIRDEQMRKATSSGWAHLVPPISSFFGTTLKYKRHSGEIRPYFQRMQSLHEETGSRREELMDLFEETGHRVDCDFLGWNYGTPYPFLEEYSETMTTFTYSTMQDKYVTLLKAMNEVERKKYKELQRLFSFVLIIPAAKNWFQIHIAPPSRERIFKETSKLKDDHKELRRKTGTDSLDSLLRVSA